MTLFRKAVRHSVNRGHVDSTISSGRERCINELRALDMRRLVDEIDGGSTASTDVVARFAGNGALGIRKQNTHMRSVRLVSDIPLSAKLGRQVLQEHAPLVKQTRRVAAEVNLVLLGAPESDHE